jgi:hypothetical protein
MTTVRWLRNRAETAFENEMPEKAGRYKAAADEIELLRAENERLKRAYLRYEFDAAVALDVLHKIVVWWDGKGTEHWNELLEKAQILISVPSVAREHKIEDAP